MKQVDEYLHLQEKTLKLTSVPAQLIHSPFGFVLPVKILELSNLKSLNQVILYVYFFIPCIIVEVNTLQEFSKYSASIINYFEDVLHYKFGTVYFSHYI